MKPDQHAIGPKVFAWITGEPTNVGDSLLRRPYLRALRRIGPVDIWVRRNTAEFLSGLDVQAADVVTPSFAVWYARLLRSSFRRRTILVLNAGESRVEPTRAVLLTLLLFASLLVRMRGGSSVWVGVGIPASARRFVRMPYRLTGRTFDYVQWRDTGSSLSTFPRAVGPDWAFSEGLPSKSWPTDGRQYLGIVLRGDRPYPSSEWLKWISGLVATHELTPVVIVQVRQDAHRAHELAQALKADVIAWSPEMSHADQETLLRDVYRRCRMVVGDRLHGLVMAATEGAVPFGWIESSRGKIRTHFDVAGLPSVGEFEGVPGSRLPQISVVEVADHAVRLATAIDQSRSDLLALQDQLASLRGSARPPELARLRKPQR